MNKIETKLKSTDNITDLHIVTWLPEEENVKGLIQIEHGITEHVGRYEEFAQFFTTRGYIVVANDIIGHGKSISKTKKEMYLGPKDSWFYVVKDFYNIYKIHREKYKNIPYIILGFSLGSFVVRTFLSMYPQADINEAVLVGTGYTSKISLELGKYIAESEAKKVGEENSTETINKLALENYNKSFRNVKTKCDWLCSNEEELEKYLKDPLVKQNVSCGLFRELLNGMIYSNSNKNIKNINKEIQILLISGKEDPVGNFSKGIENLNKRYKKNGVNNVSVKLYDGLRHDIFHEKNHNEIFEYIYNWIKTKCEEK